jgi:hypothetical protein
VKERPSDRAIARVLATNVRESPGVCPDDNIMAAYLEFRLGSTERQRLEAHVAACSSCQEILGLAMRLQSEGSIGTAQTEAPTERRVLFRFSMPVSVIALIVLGVSLAALLPRVLRKGEGPKAVDQVAENRPAHPAQAGVRAPAPESEAPRLAVTEPAPSPPRPLSRATAPPSSAVAARPAILPSAPQPPPTSDQGGATFVAAPASPPANLVSADKPVEAVRAEGALVKSAEPAAPFREVRAALREPAVPVKAELRTAEKSKDGAREPALADAERSGAANRKTAHAANAAVQIAASGQEAGSLLRAGDKTFRRVGESIVDLEALSHPDAPSVELKVDSKEYLEITAKLKGLDDLWKAGQTLTIYWQGKTFIVRR